MAATLHEDWMNIKDFLHPQAIELQLEAETSEEVIRALGGRLLDLGFVHDDFVEATLERERNMPTGLPLGGEINAAIPPGDIEFVKKSSLGLATLKQDVVFQDLAVQPVGKTGYTYLITHETGILDFHPDYQ